MKALQIRSMPEDLHRRLKVRAAQRGQSLSEYAIEVLRRAAETPTIEELADRIQSRGVAGETSTQEVVALIRADREGR
ncbi:MAG: toxin-antitoxin system, antitoxin component [Actinomycetota bacterium]|nr:toxin-antitoxin system, antitoxin component [Actinomycetota bacterium]